MNTKYFLMILALCGVLNQACEKEDSSRVNSAVKHTFTEMFPNALFVEWDIEGNYAVAEFRDNDYSREAWFDHSGTWFFTDTDIPFANLSEAVKNAFQASDYSGWRVEDVDRIERWGMEVIYVIEVENNSQEYDLYYSSDGILIKVVADTDGKNYLPVDLPSTVSGFISRNYPDAKIVETDFEKGYYETDIIVNGIHKELLFDNSGNWVYTQTELRKNEVPQNILAVLETSEYTSYHIDDIDFFETPSGNYYLFELEKGNREAKVKITVDGQIAVN
jgi:hypothetical protein